MVGTVVYVYGSESGLIQILRMHLGHFAECWILLFTKIMGAVYDKLLSDESVFGAPALKN